MNDDRSSETPTEPRAIVYAPNTADVAATARCLEYCNDQQYHLVGVVTDWDAAQRMLVSRQVAILVVDRHDDLPPDREPRLDVVADSPARRRIEGRRPGQQRAPRTRRISRRDAEA